MQCNRDSEVKSVKSLSLDAIHMRYPQRLKKIPRTQNLADMLTHTPSVKELEMFLPLMSLRRCSERDKELMTTRRYKPVPVENLKVYSHGRGGRVKFNYVFQPCNDTFQFDVIVLALYDEYTALVKSGNVASKHVNG